MTDLFQNMNDPWGRSEGDQMVNRKRIRGRYPAVIKSKSRARNPQWHERYAGATNTQAPRLETRIIFWREAGVLRETFKKAELSGRRIAHLAGNNLLELAVGLREVDHGTWPSAAYFNLPNWTMRILPLITTTTRRRRPWLWGRSIRSTTWAANSSRRRAWLWGLFWLPLVSIPRRFVRQIFREI